MRQLPSGTVTLLFTDIEGSTRLLEQLGARYEDVLKEHRRLIREATNAHGGIEVDTQGDAFFCAFARASDAVAAAERAQRSLARTPVRVRMGIHTGEPTRTEEGYVGVDLHQGARVMAAGHGGQVLLSQATRDLVSAEKDVGFRDLGEHRLKDLSEPQHLYQLVAEDLERDFPPLRTLENHATNLPLQPTPLVGRERELEELCTLLAREDVRLLTLTGPGGTGKTRLALQAAAELVDAYANGVYFVNLAALTDPELVLPTVAQTLGVREQSGEPIADTLASYLHDRKVLLLVDNFEQVADASPQLATLGATSPMLNLLVTSRAPLHVSGEREYAVPPLASGDALALFVERAQAAKTNFTLDGNRPVVVEICQRLDNLPLAIELAAARIKVLPEQALLDRLDKRLKLLTGGARDLDERQRTLRATIDWSYDLLTEEEQTRFRRLAVFSGGRTLEAIQAVCEPEGGLDVFEGIASLVDKSLLRQEESQEAEPRFVMLETIHEYARERLEDSGEAEEFRRRHAEYFLQLAEEAEDGLRGREQARWNERLERENDNLRTAIGWAIREGDARLALGIAGCAYRFWFVRGYLREGLSWLRRALGVAGAQPDALRTKALHGLAEVARLLGEYTEATKAAEENLAISERLGDLRGVARALSDLANVATHTGDLKRAASLHERSREAADEAGDTRFVAIATANLGDHAMADGDDERAARLTEAALALAHEVGARDVEAMSLVNLGSLALRAEDYARSRLLVRAGIAIAQELGMKEVLIMSLLALAAIADREGDVARAASLAAAVEFHRDLIGLSLGPNETALYETTVASAAAKLGASEFEDVSEGVRAMDLEQLLAYALADTPGEPEAL